MLLIIILVILNICIASCVLIYLNEKKIVNETEVMSRKKYYNIMLQIINKSVRHIKNNKIINNLNIIQKDLKKAGFVHKKSLLTYLFFTWIAPLLIIILGAFNQNNNSFQIVLIALLFPCMGIGYVKGRKKKTAKIFEKNVYILYKYLNSQISSGIKITSAIKTLCQIVEEPLIKKPLIEMAAIYEMTNDIEKAVGILEEYFASKEATTFVIIIEEGVKTGEALRMIQKQENISFNKYFNFIQAETNSCRAKCALIALMYAGIIILMISIPIIIEAFGAMNSIFIN